MKKIIIAILILLHCIKYDEISDTPQLIRLTESGCSRSTAYIESNKILSYGEKTFVTFLENGENDNFNVVLVEILDNEVIEKIIVGSTETNHGGASIKFDQQGRIIIIYGGHLTGLQLRYSKLPFNISSLSDEIDISKTGTALTYPSFEIDSYNNIHLICRKQNMKNLSPSYPSLNYFKIEIDNEFYMSMDKEIIAFPEYKYGNFTSSINIKDDNISIVYRIYLTEMDGSIVEKNAYGILFSKDRGVSFENYKKENVELPINFNANTILGTSEELLYYVSNLTTMKDGTNKFILTEINEKNGGSEESYLITVGEHIYRKDNIESIYEHLIDRKISVYTGISSDARDNIYLVFASVPNEKDQKWDSKDNKVCYYQLMDNNANLIYEYDLDTSRTWLPNIEQGSIFSEESKKIPKIIFAGGEISNDLYEKINGKVFLLDPN